MKCIDFKCVRKPTKSWLDLTHHANNSRHWACRLKTLNGSRVGGISPVDEEKVCGGKDLPKSQVSRFGWNTEWMTDDESGDSEYGEDDEDDEPPR